MSFKFTIKFNSNIKGVYTEETETATDYIHLLGKKTRMIDRWFNILCPYIDFHKLLHTLPNDYCKTENQHKLKLELINSHLNLLNEIDVECDNYNELRSFLTFETKPILFDETEKG